MVNNMDNQQMQNQVEAFRQMAQQQGMGGVAYIDAYPASGSLRLKLKVTSPEYQAKLTSSFAYVLAQLSQAFCLQVNTHQKKSEETGNQR